jgi:hypothetical protein
MNLDEIATKYAVEAVNESDMEASWLGFIKTKIKTACMETLHQAHQEGLEDSARLDWLEAHPLAAEIQGGAEDGDVGKAWAFATHRGTARETLDSLRAQDSNPKPFPGKIL